MAERFIESNGEISAQSIFKTSIKFIFLPSLFLIINTGSSNITPCGDKFLKACVPREK